VSDNNPFPKELSKYTRNACVAIGLAIY